MTRPDALPFVIVCAVFDVMFAAVESLCELWSDAWDNAAAWHRGAR